MVFHTAAFYISVGYRICFRILTLGELSVASLRGFWRLASFPSWDKGAQEIWPYSVSR